MNKTLPLSVAALAILLVATTAQSTQAQHVQASHAWIRVLPGSLPAAGFVTLHNDAGTSASLTGARSIRYGNVMLHRSTNTDGMSRMAMVPALTLPAHGQTGLAPGGYHLMLMQSVRSVKPGDHVPVTLTFADGSVLPVVFLARQADALDAGD